MYWTKKYKNDYHFYSFSISDKVRKCLKELKNPKKQGIAENRYMARSVPKVRKVQENPNTEAFSKCKYIKKIATDKIEPLTICFGKTSKNDNLKKQLKSIKKCMVSKKRICKNLCIDINVFFQNN